MSKNYVSKLLKVAEAEVGYLEKATNSQLDSKTANAGFNDWNKYARDLDKKYPTFLNGPKNGGKGFWWCDIFVVWCFVKAFGESEAHKLLCQPLKSMGASCTASVNYYKAKNQWHDKNETPKPGDQIIFQSGGSPCHTGIVYKVDSNYVYTIEGNTSSGSGVVANGGCVAKKMYRRSSTYIYGYGRPKFDKEPIIKEGFEIGRKTYFTKEKNVYYADGKKRVPYSKLNQNWKKHCRKGKTGKAIFLEGKTATLKDVVKANSRVYGIFGGKNYKIILIDKKGLKTAKQ